MPIRFEVLDRRHESRLLCLRHAGARRLASHAGDRGPATPRRPGLRAKGAGVGDLLIADAVKRVLMAAESVAAYAIVVDAKDDGGRGFYESHGFISLPSRANRLFLLTETAARALEQAAK